MSVLVRSCVVAVFVLAGCTATDTPLPVRRSTPPPEPEIDVPIALVVHHARGRLDISAEQARAVMSGATTNWADLEEPRAPLAPITADVPEAAALEASRNAEAAVDTVAGDPDALAVVPVTAVTPRVRTVRVDDISPVTEPDDYPLTTSTPDEPGAVVTTSIVGDIMLGRRVGKELDRAGDPAAVFRPLADRLASADVTVGNLESTLSTDGVPTQGGDSFGADPGVVEGLDLASFDVLSLANNHLGDYGDRAIRQTVRRLRRAGFATTGGGVDIEQARKPAIVERSGVRIGFIATDSIGETPAASADGPGTNRIDAPPRTGPLDRRALARVASDIRDLDEKVDIVVVMPHWGTQYTNEPEESQRTMARTFASAGADLVVGGHPHWVQGWETVGDTTVVHSLGNFVFDMDFMKQTQEGLFVEVTSWGDRIVAIEPRTYLIGDDFAPRAVSGSRAKDILDLVRESSERPYDTLR